MVVVVLGLPLAGRADWDPDDPAKWVQMPRLDGWDINASGGFLADDFECLESGVVTDVHIWGSWKGDSVGTISSIRVEFWCNDPDDDGGGPDYAKPLTPIWGHDFGPDRVTERLWDEGDRGWFNPLTGGYTQDDDWPDHHELYQYNIDMSGLQTFFEQEEGTVYWLLVKATLQLGSEDVFGWSTGSSYGGAAVYDAMIDQWPIGWHELNDPDIVAAVVPLNLSFVINSVPVPEPGVLIMAGFGVLALLRRRR